MGSTSERSRYFQTALQCQIPLEFGLAGTGDFPPFIKVDYRLREVNLLEEYEIVSADQKFVLCLGPFRIYRRRHSRWILSFLGALIGLFLLSRIVPIDTQSWLALTVSIRLGCASAVCIALPSVTFECRKAMMSRVQGQPVSCASSAIS